MKRPLSKTSVAVIVPVLNEAAGIAAFLRRLRDHDTDEIILVDGGSHDDTVSTARGVLSSFSGAAVLQAARGRSAQMNAGAAHARSDVLLFLHADTVLPAGAADSIRRGIAGGALWGHFEVRLAASGGAYRIIEWAMNLRSRLSGIATGDQCIFVRRSTFEAAGGFADIPLMEDVELSRRLRRLGTPARISERVTTSARRWERDGVVRTVLLMWWLRARYFLGADPGDLATRYSDGR